MKEKFINKYSSELKAIYEKYDMDKGVCADILIAWCRKLDNPDKQYVYDFEGSEYVDLDELRKDIKELEDNFEIPRFENGEWRF